MKRFFLLLFLLGIMTHTAHSQTYQYQPFPDSAAKWRVSYNYGESSHCQNYLYVETYDYTYGTDTIVEGHTYKKIYKSGISYCDYPNSPRTRFSKYAGAIRQDTALRKVYVLNNNTDAVLYDFSQKKGDTVKSILVTCPTIIDSVYTVKFDDSSVRKVFDLNIGEGGCGIGYLIEGVGSSFGLLEKLFHFESGGRLICFAHNGKALEGDSNSCNSPLSSGISQILSDEITVYPNPINGTTLLHIKFLRQEQIKQVNIYNSLGMLVNEMHDFTPAQEIQLEINENFGKGLYTIEIITNDHLYSGYKFIIN